jgi:hypothetical protein
MDDLRQRAAGQILRSAMLSPFSAVIIAAGIILLGLQIPVPIVNASPVWWLAGLVPLWAAAVGSRLFSKSAGEHAVQQVLREQFDTNAITNPHLKLNIAQAIAYRQRIDQTVERFKDSGMQTRMQDVANQVEEWVRRIYTLSRRLDTFRNDSIISDDMRSVPDSINKLRARLAKEDNPGIQREIQDTINRREAQLESLQKLDHTMDRAELQLENTLTALGTVYSQMLLLDAKDVDSSKTQRLRENILEQVNSLNDVIGAMDEVYGAESAVTRGAQNMSAG